MKIGPSTSSEPLTPLPTEIIVTIVDFLDRLQDGTIRQRSLWGCGLLSKSWYSASVKTLYHTPRLTGRNFHKFSRTICPPVHSNARAIGLESLVVHLDMGGLAYESTKSLTARLLRRTRNSLESFIAPAVSFSLGGLAPISKSLKLRSLDLSNDYYNINLNDLLRSVRDIEHLHFLSLPRSALHTTLLSISKFSFRWPSNLTHLQVNAALPDDNYGWESFVESLPQSLKVLAFHHLRDHSPFWNLQYTCSTASQVSKITIGEPLRVCELELKGILKTFPELKKLSVPVSGWNGGEFALAPVHGGGKLRHLRLNEAGGIFDGPMVLPKHLLKFVEPLPALRRIDLPEACLQVSDDNDREWVVELKNTLASRSSKSAKSDTGVFLFKRGAVR